MEEGQVFDLGGRKLEVMLMAGHTPVLLFFLTVNKEIVIRVMLSAQERYGCNVYQCLQ